MSAFDHLALAASDLVAQAPGVAEALGVPLETGGQHPTMGTWNRLAGLGPGEYLELIAIDPSAAPPGRPRWFGLDHFAGPARPVAWVVRVPDLDAALARAQAGAGRPMDLARGDLRWRMAVPDDGMLPFDGLFPALIEWQGAAHPADQLPDRGLRLAELELVHPQAEGLRSALAGVIADPRLSVVTGPRPGLRARLAGPSGTVVLA